jgi:hypothetical protein
VAEDPRRFQLETVVSAASSSGRKERRFLYLYGLLVFPPAAPLLAVSRRLLRYFL